MLLNEYFDKYKIVPMAFALKLGVSLSTIYRFLKGEKTTSRTIANNVVRITDGEVSFDEMYKKKGSK